MGPSRVLVAEYGTHLPKLAQGNLPLGGTPAQQHHLSLTGRAVGWVGVGVWVAGGSG